MLSLTLVVLIERFTSKHVSSAAWLQAMGRAGRDLDREPLDVRRSRPVSIGQVRDTRTAEKYGGLQPRKRPGLSDAPWIRLMPNPQCRHSRAP